MRKVSITVAVGMLSLLMASCSGDTSSPPPSTTQTVTPAATTAEPGKTEAFSQPTVPGKEQKVVVKQIVPETQRTIVVPGLIQSTNPDARVQQVQKGRVDPFAVIPVQPVVTILPNALTPPRAVPNLPDFPILPVPPTAVLNRIPTITTPGGGNRGTTNRGTTTRGTTTRGTTATGTTTRRTVARVNPPRTFPLPPISSVPTFKPELPKLPEPLLARGVEVSGVIQVDGIIQAIVKAPNEATSRYVGVGQRLSNGQVLVKRIEMIQGTSPVVILEQYGIEVTRQVGEKVGTTSQQLGSPTAAIPLLPSVNANSSPQA